MKVVTLIYKEVQMKLPTTFIIFGMAVISPVMLSCNKATEPQTPVADVFQVHLQARFLQTPVEVKLDNSVVFFGAVTTSDVLGLALAIPLQATTGEHSIRVTVGHSITKDTTFTLSDTLFVGVRFGAVDSKITYIFQNERFLYD